MSTSIKIEWKPFGSFSKIESQYSELKSGKGVYLWVYNGQPKRVVYVGTAIGEDGFFGRLCTVRVQMLCRKHYCFKYDPLIDAYEKYLTKNEEEIKKLVEDGEFYYPDSNIVGANNFSTKDFLEYQEGISIYTADLSKPDNGKNIETNSKFLETQIQVFLLGTYNIRYYKRYGFQSWLGKVEKLRKSHFEEDFKELLEYEFEFSLPEIEELNRFPLSRLPDSKLKDKLKKW